MALATQIALHDPRERLAATLKELDEAVERANKRFRFVNGERYLDPDGTTVLRAIELGAKLIAEYHAQALASVESIGTLDRAQACAELRAVLEAWEDPGVSDEQWRASRRASTPVEVAPRGSVKRRAKPSL